jgi:hypothetical protein
VQDWRGVDRGFVGDSLEPLRPPRKSSTALALLGAALTGEILAAACGVLYAQHFGPSSIGITVGPAPVIRSSGSAAINPAAIYESDAQGVVLV